MIEKWVNFKRDYLEISFLRENWVNVPLRRITDDMTGYYIRNTTSLHLYIAYNKSPWKWKLNGHPLLQFKINLQ